MANIDKKSISGLYELATSKKSNAVNRVIKDVRQREKQVPKPGKKMSEPSEASKARHKIAKKARNDFKPYTSFSRGGPSKGKLIDTKEKHEELQKSNKKILREHPEWK